MPRRWSGGKLRQMGHNTERLSLRLSKCLVWGAEQTDESVCGKRGRSRRVRCAPGLRLARVRL